MEGARIRVLELGGSPPAMGSAHGRDHADEIRAYAADRLALAREGTRLTEEETVELAAACLPAHQEYAADLFDEMSALAAAAGISEAEAVIVGGYTDFVDVVRAHSGEAPISDNCTAVLVPDAAATGPGYLAQTWDMHASATPRVVMLRLTPAAGPAALVFSTVGCLGQIGMNEAGIAVGINNLTAADGRIGVTWPFVVRKALQQTDLDSAVECVVDAPLAGGHNYLLFDRTGNGVNIEAMPTAHRITVLEGKPLVHTNHCLAPETRSVEGDRPADLDESSLRRLEDAAMLLSERPVDTEGLMAFTRHSGSICRRAAPPYDYQTCGAVIMRPRTGEMWACWGVPSEAEYERFELEGIAV